MGYGEWGEWADNGPTAHVDAKAATEADKLADLPQHAAIRPRVGGGLTLIPWDEVLRYPNPGALALHGHVAKLTRAARRSAPRRPTHGLGFEWAKIQRLPRRIPDHWS